MRDVIPTEELHLAYRVVDVLSGRYPSDVVTTAVLQAAAELLRVAYRQRTLHDPLPGQTTLVE